MNDKVVLVGEPMGLFIAKEEGALGKVENFSAAVAGAEYNVAVGLSRLGQKVSFCTRLGNDPMADRILHSMEKNKISRDLVTQTDEALTGFMMKGTTENGDPEIAYFRRNSAASTISPHDIDVLDLYMCKYLHITGIFPAVSKSAMAAVKRLLQRAKALDIAVSFDPNLRPQLWENEKAMVIALNSLAESANTVLPGLSEGKILTGASDPQGVAEFYHKMGVTNVIVKLGEKGAYYSGMGQNKLETGYVPGFPVTKVIDTVGAGDGFAAGVLSALMEGLPLKEVAERGAVIGAIQVTHKGDNEGLPTKKRLIAIMAKGKAN
ncbi:MAG: sugar kinase [Oscillospiraceae bacterium]